MKLYAVCIKAKMNINDEVFAERWCPISKVIGAPREQLGPFRYAPAIFTNKKIADKYLNKMKLRCQQLGMRMNYELIDFDSGEVAYPVEVPVRG